MAMRLPPFHGDEKEHSMNIKDFIARFESSCTAIGMNIEADK
jgi:hypothetical protein